MKNFIYGLGLGLVAVLVASAAQDDTDEEAFRRALNQYRASQAQPIKIEIEHSVTGHLYFSQGYIIGKPGVPEPWVIENVR